MLLDTGRRFQMAQQLHRGPGNSIEDTGKIHDISRAALYGYVSHGES
jgi:hypothetical protein